MLIQNWKSPIILLFVELEADDYDTMKEVDVESNEGEEVQTPLRPKKRSIKRA